MDDHDIIESIVRGMIERFGDVTAGFGHEQAEIADALSDMLAAETCRASATRSSDYVRNTRH